jgi:hypothetical protein
MTVVSHFRIMVLAGDTLPIEVYCHLPVMCEDRNLPYVYIPSKTVRTPTLLHFPKNKLWSSLGAWDTVSRSHSGKEHKLRQT